MSGYGKRAPRKRSPIPVYRGPNDEAQADRMAARAKALAPVLGYCPSCGEHVDEASGKKHDPWCPDVTEERRAAR